MGNRPYLGLLVQTGLKIFAFSLLCRQVHEKDTIKDVFCLFLPKNHWYAVLSKTGLEFSKLKTVRISLKGVKAVVKQSTLFTVRYSTCLRNNTILFGKRFLHWIIQLISSGSNADERNSNTQFCCGLEIYCTLCPNSGNSNMSFPKYVWKCIELTQAGKSSRVLIPETELSVSNKTKHS